MAVSICRSCSVALCKDHLVSSFYSDRVAAVSTDVATPDTQAAH
jgi:hypothetical protein